MRELPILFSGEMVRAILDDHKSMTRRVVDNDLSRPSYLGYLCDGTHIGRWAGTKRNEGTLWAGFYKDSDIFTIDGVEHIDAVYKKCPYGQPGDHLWVRETWCNINKPEFTPEYYYKADIDSSVEDYDPSEWKWKPSIHMPKAAARIWLEVTDVRVERLTTISESDAMAEGIILGDDPTDPIYCPQCKGEGLIGAIHPVSLGYMEIDCPYCDTAVKRFKNLWDSLNAKRGYGWDTNPWVWVIEFRRVER